MFPGSDPSLSTSTLARASANVVTVCDSARQVCPTFPGNGERLHWDIEDPSDTEARGVPLADAFRLAREKLRRQIEGFVRNHQA